MRRRVRRSVTGAASLTAAVMLTACGGGVGTDSGSEPPKEQNTSEQRQQSGTAAQAVTAVAKKTSDAKTARVSLTASGPGALGGGAMKMSGVMGWEPMALDVKLTMSGTAEPSTSSSAMRNLGRLVWVDDAMYVDMGVANVDEASGKRWMKLDLGAALDESDKAERNPLSGGLDSLNAQNPAQQMALLLTSPHIKHMGEQKIDGVTAEHYKGTLTADDVNAALKADYGLDFLSKAERDQLADTVRNSGIEGYEIQAWVNDDLPVRIKTTVDTPQGKVSVLQKLSDYGVDVSVQAPPADQTVDLREIMRRFGGAGGTGI